MSLPPVSEQVFLIETSKISPNPFQPRSVFDDDKLRDLAESIREYGILQPLVVTKVEEETETGIQIHYQLIAGERRFRASMLIGLDRVPAVIRNIGLDRQRLELAIVENVQRADLNPIEAARAYARLQEEFNLTQREIAHRIGKSREVIANTMRLLNLPTKIQEAVSRGVIGESQARILLSIEDQKQQQILFEEIRDNSLSVRATKAKISYLKSIDRKKESDSSKTTSDSMIEIIKKQLETSLGTPVKVEQSGSTGRITIEFYSSEELQAIANRFKTQEIEVTPEVEEPLPKTEIEHQVRINIHKPEPEIEEIIDEISPDDDDRPKMPWEDNLADKFNF